MTKRMWNIGGRYALRIAVLGVLSSTGCKKFESGGAPAPAPTKVTIGIQVSPAMTLLMVAKDRGLFLAQGLDVELKEFTAGKFALQAFLAGSIDFAVSGDVPVCLAALQGNQIKVVTQVVEHTINEVRIVARRDGPTTPDAWFHSKKRKLATSFGGGPEFFTYKFLKAHSPDKDSVEVLSQRPEDMPAALESGSVDAVAIFDPFAFIAEKRMKERGITFTDPSLYSEIYVLNARPEQLQRQAVAIEGVIRGLLAASEFVAKDPESSKQILQRYTKLDRDVIDGIWANFAFRPALTRQLLEFWTDEAQWAASTGKIKAGTKVDPREMVDATALRRVSASAVQF